MAWSTRSRVAASHRAIAQPRVIGSRGWYVFASTGRRHATRSMYAAGCRCMWCRGANAAYQRARARRPKPAPTRDPALDAIIASTQADVDAYFAELNAEVEAANATMPPEDRAIIDGFDVTDIVTALRGLS